MNSRESVALKQSAVSSAADPPEKRFHARDEKTVAADQQRARLSMLFRGGKFMAVGWLGMLVNSAVLFTLKGGLHVPLIPASMIAIEVAIIHNFIWHRQWAWAERNNGHKKSFFRQLLLYNAATGAVDFSVNISVLWSLSTFLNVHYMLANIVGMCAGPFVKFWLNDKIIFKET